MKRIVQAAVMLTATAALLSCSAQKPDDADAYTAATPQGDKELPPPGDTYEVVGWAQGLAGYIVKYSDDVYRGGDIESAEGAQGLADWGIKTVISVTPADEERKFTAEHGLGLVEITFEKGEALPREQLDRFIEAVTEQPGPFYIHCQGGSHRGGTLCAYYRMKVDGWSFEEAAAEFEALGGEPGRRRGDAGIAEGHRSVVRDSDRARADGLRERERCDEGRVQVPVGSGRCSHRRRCLALRRCP